jgi:DMSO reductase family type II enzyme chaperone
LDCGSPLPLSDGAREGSAEVALSRSFVHQWLARAFDYPAAQTWSWLCSTEVMSGVCSSIAAIESDVRAPLRAQLDALREKLRPDAFEAFHNDYITAIGHAARGSCPVNEIEYGDLKADPLFQPHRLADLAAFYRAFGMDLCATADERPDHLSVELEFLAVLAAQEASMLSRQVSPAGLPVCRDAQRKFLREHLGRWTPAFARRLARVVGDGALGSLALFTLAFIESECGRFSVKPGSEDLLLRLADEGAALCDGCGISQALPGAPAAQPCG